MVGRLLKVLPAAVMAKDLERLSKDGIEWLDAHKAVVITSYHRGDQVLNSFNWVSRLCCSVVDKAWERIEDRCLHLELRVLGHALDWKACARQVEVS